MPKSKNVDALLVVLNSPPLNVKNQAVKVSMSILKFNPYEPPRGKTNNVVSDQVRHKPTCTVTEKS